MGDAKRPSRRTDSLKIIENPVRESHGRSVTALSGADLEWRRFGTGKSIEDLFGNPKGAQPASGVMVLD